MKLAKSIFIYAIGIIGIYLYIFNPVYLPFRSMGLVKCLYPLILLYVFGEYRRSFLRFRSISKLYLGAIFICMFSALLNAPETIYTRFVNYIEFFLLPPIFATILLKYDIKLPFIVFSAALLASFISLYAFLTPSFLQLLRSVQPVAESVNDYTLSVREFGFSSELYSGFGWSLGLITVYMLYNIKNYSLFLVTLPLIFFAILINSRSGFLAVIIGLVVYLLFNRKISTLTTIAAIAVLLLLVVKYVSLEWINEGTMAFITDFFNQLSDFIKGNRDNTSFAVYKGYQFVLPDNIFEWVFGRGFRLMGNKYGVATSDIGYLNDLAIGGIFYVFFVYLVFWKLFRLIKVKWFFIATITIFMVLNIKGSALETNGLSRILILIVFYETLSKGMIKKVTV